MEQAQQVTGWSVRSSTPGADVPLKALVFYPTEFKPLEKPGRPDQAGLRIPRRGVFTIDAEHQQAWTVLAGNIERGSQLVLRERSGRNHEITPGWKIMPSDQEARYGSDGLAGLAELDETDLIVPWRAKDITVLDDLSWIIR